MKKLKITFVYAVLKKYICYVYNKITINKRQEKSFLMIERL